MKNVNIVTGNSLQSERARVSRRTWIATAINLAIHAAIKALSCLGVRRVYRPLEELFCADFLWFLCAHTGWPARDKSFGLVTCKSRIDERSSTYAYVDLLPGAQLAPSIDVLDERIRHACLLRAISMGGLDDPLGADVRGALDAHKPPSQLHHGARTLTTTAMLPSALRRRLFASVTLSPIDSRYSNLRFHRPAFHESCRILHTGVAILSRTRYRTVTLVLFSILSG